MMARRWDILTAWGFISFWDMQEMLDTRKGGGNWRVGDARIVRTWPFVSGGVSLTWFCWARSAAGGPLSLTHGSGQAPHVLFQCSSVLLYWVSSWFCRARVCQSLPLHSHVVTLSPSCRAPLQSLPPLRGQANRAPGIWWGLFPEHPCSPSRSGSQSSADCHMSLTRDPSSPTLANM